MSKEKQLDEVALKQKQNIMKAAVQIFAKKGYTKTKVEDISNHLGISKSLVYYYFKTKEELYTESIYSLESQIDEFSQRNIPPDINAFEKIRLRTQNIFKFFSDNPNMLIVFTYHDQVKKLSEKHKKRIKQHFYNKIKILANDFKKAQEDRIIDSNDDPEALALLLFSQITVCISYPLMGSKKFNPAELFNLIDKYFFQNLKYTA